MNVVNIHEAKTHLSKLVVKVIAIDAPVGKKMRRMGFMAGKISVPDDFDRMFEKEIEQMFCGEE